MQALTEFCCVECDIVSFLWLLMKSQMLCNSVSALRGSEEWQSPASEVQTEGVAE